LRERVNVNVVCLRGDRGRMRVFESVH